MKSERQDNLPPGTLVIMNVRGSMNTETFMKWIEHLANPVRLLHVQCSTIIVGVYSHSSYNIVQVLVSESRQES